MKAQIDFVFIAKALNKVLTATKCSYLIHHITSKMFIFGEHCLAIGIGVYTVVVLGKKNFLNVCNRSQNIGIMSIKPSGQLHKNNYKPLSVVVFILAIDFKYRYRNVPFESRHIGTVRCYSALYWTDCGWVLDPTIPLSSLHS